MNESVLGSDDAMDALDELEKTEESSDEDCSSHEVVEDKKLLEENIFSVEDFFSIATAGTCNSEKEINDISLKNCEVVVNSLLEVLSQKKSNGDSIKQYRRRRVAKITT